LAQAGERGEQTRAQGLEAKFVRSRLEAKSIRSGKTIGKATARLPLIGTALVEVIKTTADLIRLIPQMVHALKAILQG
jgi:hypothetical protein